MPRHTEQLLRDPQAADFLNVSIAWLQRQRWLGTGPCYIKVGARAVRYRKDDLDAWVSANLHGRSANEVL